MPAITPSRIAKIKSDGINQYSAQGNDIDFPETMLKYGIMPPAITAPMTKETMLKRIDSVKNWLMMLLRKEPTTFLKPTSFARFADLAVDKLTKLMTAIKRINKAIPPKSQTIRISPCRRLSLAPSEKR